MKKLLCCVLLLLSISAVHAESAGEILTFPARAEKGFEWGYLLYLPATMDPSKKLPILLNMTNEDETDGVENLTRAAVSQVRTNYSLYGIADGVGVPMLMPLVLQARAPYHTHQLNRAVFTLREGPFARLDEQVLAMLQDARMQLGRRGVRTEKKFLVAGFSTPGVFAWNWTMLHPKEVLAAVVGGHQYPMLPLCTYGGTDLIYPIGVYDVKTYTGQKFDFKTWRQIPILLVSGGEDYNDPLPYDSVYSNEERTVFRKIYGDGNLQQMWRNVQKILALYAPQVQMHTYPKLGHEAVWADEIEFLKTHINGGPLRPITLTETSTRTSLLPIRIVALYFGQQAPIQEDREYLQDTDLILQTDKEAPYWVRYKNACSFDVLCGNKEIVSGLSCDGMFDTEKGYDFLQIHLSSEQTALLKEYADCDLSVRSHYPEILLVSPDVTFKLR